jgi:hypothetical protein
MNKYNISFKGRQVGAIGIFYRITEEYNARNLGEFKHMLYTDYEHLDEIDCRENGKRIDRETWWNTDPIKTDYTRKANRK